MNPSFEITETIQPENRDAVVRGLLEFNALHLGEYRSTPLDVYARDSEGRVVGGLIGDFALGWLSIHALWVAEEHRGAGIGSRLLQSAEEAAVRNGCRAAILDTMSFQAPEFYEKRGYVRIGQIEDYRGGAQRIFMQKRLTTE